MKAGYSSWRTSALPPGWDKIRAAVLARDKNQCKGIRAQGKACPFPATEVDHMNGPDDHRLEALQALCRTCHGRKTQQEAEEAKKNRYRKSKEVHPFYK